MLTSEVFRRGNSLGWGMNCDREFRLRVGILYDTQVRFHKLNKFIVIKAYGIGNAESTTRGEVDVGRGFQK